MKLIDQLKADVGDFSKSRPIRAVDMKYFGFTFAARVGIKDTGYLLYELLDEDSSRPATFCFLVAKRTNIGVVVPFPFKKYIQERAEPQKQKTPTPKKRQGKNGATTT